MRWVGRIEPNNFYKDIPCYSNLDIVPTGSIIFDSPHMVRVYSFHLTTRIEIRTNKNLATLVGCSASWTASAKGTRSLFYGLFLSYLTHPSEPSPASKQPGGSSDLEISRLSRSFLFAFRQVSSSYDYMDSSFYIHYRTGFNWSSLLSFSNPFSTYRRGPSGLNTIHIIQKGKRASPDCRAFTLSFCCRSVCTNNMGIG